jgi:hypothetical protein
VYFDSFFFFSSFSAFDSRFHCCILKLVFYVVFLFFFFFCLLIYVNVETQSNVTYIYIIMQHIYNWELEKPYKNL